MIVIDENEDIIDDQFFKSKKKKQNNDIEKEKSKTTNIADLLHEIKKKGNKKIFENTHDITKLKKNSFFSQSK